MADEADKRLAELERLAQNRRHEEALRIGVQLAPDWIANGCFAEGRAQITASLAAAPDASPALRAQALQTAGSLAFEQGANEEARSLFEESLALAELDLDKAGALRGLARCALMDGDLDTAREHARACEQIHRARGDERALDSPLHILAYADYIAGDDELARAGFEETQAVEIDNSTLVTYCIVNLGGVASATGEHERAARLLGAAERMLDAAGMTLNPGTAIEYARHVERPRAALGDAEYERLTAAGRELDREAAIDYALNGA